ncbi:MAG: formate/nitrite transporter family protein [Pseudomonadota bacterium]|nr:formate/nitrite transporter family protein [Pseudomonadota bacterium]
MHDDITSDDRPTPDERVEEEEQQEEIREASKLSPTTIYEVIRLDGEEELRRNRLSLMWSGISAGIVISLSVLGEAILRSNLPDTPARYLIENVGYSLGFLVVIVGRMQLFTENTLTTVLPLLDKPGWRILGATAALWVIVLAANVIGAFVVALFYVHAGAINADLMAAMVALSEHAMSFSPGQAFAKGIPAGVLVAAIVWMMPQVKDAAVAIIVIFTWLIAAGDFTHIVAGSVEMALLIVRGDLAVLDGLFDFFIPVLAGNVIGGTAIFTMLIYGQTRRDRGY